MLRFPLILVLAVILLIFLNPIRAAEPRPNIILAIADDMGCAAPSSYGHPFSNTPNIDKMASQGVRFNRFYAAFPQCTPTRASVLTGRDPGRAFCIDAGSTMPVEERTLAEVLKENGYTTAHIGKWHIGGMMYGNRGVQEWYKNVYRNLPQEKWPSPLNQGFEYSYSIGNMMDNYRESWKRQPNTGPVGDKDLGGWMLQKNGRTVAQNGQPAFIEGDTSMILVQRALEVIRQSKPFFICLWFTSPHGPYVAAPEHEALYKEKSIDAASPLQLFNLSNDPGEKRNLADDRDHSARIAAMKKSASEWDLSVRKDFQTHADRGEIRH